MRNILRAACFCSMLLLIAGLSQPALAQSDATLSERIITAIREREPTWRFEQPLRGMLAPGPSLQGLLDGDGYEIRLALSAHPSAREAAEALDRERSMIRTAMPPSPMRTAWRDFQKANILISIIADARNWDGRAQQAAAAGNTARPSPASVVVRLARIIEGLISADVRADACVNELFPDPRPAPASPREAFFREIEAGCLPKVEQALAAGADANAHDAQGTTALMRAVTAGHREVTRALLRAGADPNATAGATGTALFRVFSRPSTYYARDVPRILANQLAILDDLLAAGASLETRNEYGRTLLLEAARMNYDDGSMSVLLKGLVERGADVSARDRDERTALILAVLHTHPKVSLETIPILLEAGADVNARDASGKTAMDYAREKADRTPFEDWGRVVRLLAAAGATQTDAAETSSPAERRE